VYLFPGSPGPGGTLPAGAEETGRVPEIGLVRIRVIPRAPPALPALGPWVFAPGSPETEPGFDDSAWEEIPGPDAMSPDLYGFHHGFVWYRGRYTPLPGVRPEAVRLDARHCYSVYWNGRFLGSHDSFTTGLLGPGAAGSPDLFPDPVDFPIPAEAVEETNTVAVLVENLGHNKGYAFFYDILNPRGVLSAEIEGDPGARILWKIQGRAAQGEPDPFNASGLHGEREGYYLPGHDDAGWAPVGLPHDWDRDGPLSPGAEGTGWYRTRFRLDLPEGLEIPLCLRIRRASSKALVWLNGRLLGRYWEEQGPQSRFYLPEGVLRRSGENVLAVCLWRRGDEAGALDPAVLDIAGLEPYPLDHRVSGGPAAGGPSAPGPFSATRFDIPLRSGGVAPVAATAASGDGGCGACSNAGGQAPPWGGALPLLLVAAFLQAVRRRLRR